MLLKDHLGQRRNWHQC